MSPERLDELRRQRALVRQHLEWLDREIAAAAPEDRPATPMPTSPVATATPPHPAAATLPTYEPDPEGARQAARRGCFILAAIILALLTISLVAIYYWRYRDRPLLFAPTASTILVAPVPGSSG